MDVNSHTILLLRPDSSPYSRTYCDYGSVKLCLETLCRVFEEHLKRHTDNKHNITYSVGQLYDFIDSFEEISCLVFLPATKSYMPYSKEWIKGQLYVLLCQKVTKIV